MSYFFIKKDKRGEFRWSLDDDNYKTIADSGEGYSSEYACERAIENVKREAPRATVISMVSK